MRNELRVGMQIEHKYRQSAPKDWGYDWFATVNEIDTEANELSVSITGQHGSHLETWNLEHTKTALRRMEYVEIKVDQTAES